VFLPRFSSSQASRLKKIAIKNPAKSEVLTMVQALTKLHVQTKTLVLLKNNL
jgi:hypothetical protein